MKVLAAVACHYGKEYLRYALESVYDHVDDILIVYSAVPSYGHGTTMQNPDSKGELQKCCDGLGVQWMDVAKVSRENVHRQHYIDYARLHNYDQVLVVDSDEVHDPDRVPELLQAARAKSDHFNIGVRGNHWITPWKSFTEYVQDGFAPVRVLNLAGRNQETAYVEAGMIFHMGYCISDELMAYKISCHGHKEDFNKNQGWYRDKWLGYKRGITKNLHPATEAYWQETKTLDVAILPEPLKQHPRYPKYSA